MKMRSRSFALLSFLLFTPFLIATTVDATLKIRKKTEKPTFASPEEERTYRLKAGEILSEGGYEGRAVWGRMEGVVQAPPEVVWKIFLSGDRWKEWRFPTLIEARVVNEEMTNRAAKRRDVHFFYKVVGEERVDPETVRKKKGVWTFYSFQYYDVPWPVANRWMILKVENDETLSAKGIYHAEWVKVAGNVRTVDGYLHLERFEGSRKKTLLVYRASSDPGSHVPRFLVRWGVDRVMPGVIRAVRRAARDLKRDGWKSFQNLPGWQRRNSTVVRNLRGDLQGPGGS